MASPSDRQLEKHIKYCAVDSAHVVFTDHARQRMRKRFINDPMVLDVLRNGVMAPKPEPDMKHTGLKCRMQRYVAGVQVAVVVYVTAKESPFPTVFEPPIKLPAEYKTPVVESLVSEAEAPELIKHPLTVPALVRLKVTTPPVLEVTFDGVVPDEVAAVQLICWRLPV